QELRGRSRNTWGNAEQRTVLVVRERLFCGQILGVDHEPHRIAARLAIANGDLAGGEGGNTGPQVSFCKLAESSWPLLNSTGTYRFSGGLSRGGRGGGNLYDHRWRLS